MAGSARRGASSRSRTTSARSGGGGTKRAATRTTPARKAPARKRAPAKRSPARTRREPLLDPRQRRDAVGFVLVALGCYLAGTLYLGWQGGSAGAAAEHVLRLLVGNGALLFPLVAMLVGALLVLRSELIDPGPFRAGLWLMCLTLLLVFGGDRFGIGPGNPPVHGLDPHAAVHHGGVLGGVVFLAVVNLFGEAGTNIVALLGLTLGLLFLTGSSAQVIARWWAGRIGEAAVAAGGASRTVAVRIGEGATAAAASATSVAGPFDGSEAFPDIFGDVPSSFARAVLPGESALEAGTAGMEGAAQGAGRRKRKRKGAGTDGVPDDQLALLEAVEAVPADELGSDADAWLGGGSAVAEANAEASEQAGEATAAAADDDEDAAEAAPVRRRRSPAKPKRGEVASDTVLRARIEDAYTLPDPAILERSTGPVEVKPEEVNKIKRLLVETFGHFGIVSKVVGLVPGPRVSRYELSLAPGTKMSKVENLRKDLAYALATTEIRILAPIPGKSAVGIEIENAKPSMVTLGDIYHPRPKGSSPLHVWFGKDISGEVVGADLAKMPHLLVAGTTGAGKSGCMNAMLSSIVLGASPDEVRMVLIDPKKVELSTYESIPHLLTPVVTNMKKAANALGNIVAQMEERYSSMELAGARTLPEYNKIRVTRGEEPVPYILVVIDELADLVMQAKADVEDAVIRVAQKGRAAGFHMVVATQRPSVDVITGMIKSNIPSRIAFAVSSQTDSRVILDQNGAETLLGSGDMLFKPVWARTVQRVQGAWIGEPEVRALCDAARDQREPDYDADLLAEPEVALQTSDDPNAVDQDDRLAEAIRLVAEFQTCSASFFQRRMRVGYTRGARLVDMLERRGVCAPGEGPRPRNVLITMDDVPRLLDDMAGEQLQLAAEDA